MRPARLSEVLGQAHLTENTGPLAAMLDSGRLQSMIFWGPPGTGKTTLSRILAAEAGLPWTALSAVSAGVKDVRRVLEAAAPTDLGLVQPQVLFLDEIHRFNKAQQDALLPAVESGEVVLIGATTENPSFEVNSALLSRSRVFVLNPVGTEALSALLRAAAGDTARGLGGSVGLDDAAIDQLAGAADGDARRALHLLDALAAKLSAAGRAQPEAEDLDQVLVGGVRRFDRQGEQFYNQISAMHKAVRGTDPDAALYWCMRMLDGGVDPMYLGRRMLRMASEDIGNADPRALQIAGEACRAFERLGSPEGELALAQTAVYLAVAPKSTAVYAGFKAAKREIARSGSLEVPMHIRNAPTGLMKELGYGDGYRYDPDQPDQHAIGQTYLPDALLGSTFYAPTEQGLEARISERLRRIRGRSE